LDETNRRDVGFVMEHTSGVEAALEAAGLLDLKTLAATTGLSPAELSEFFRLWAETERVVTIYSQGVNQWSTGTDKVNAILNCHLFTGRIGKPGCGPFSVTGQPNAMGGREVGGLANMLAAHMAIENEGDRERVQRFWRAPRIAERPGLKAVDMFEALGDGRIKALWVMATNPAVSLPDADRVAQSIRSSGGFVAVSDIMRRTDTTELADVLLPATGWGEKDGTVTNSERRISRQRGFLPAPGEARHDWLIICDVARAIGRRLGDNWDAAFTYPGAAAIFREHARLSGFENNDARAFDISGLAELPDAEYDALEPVRWPVRAGGGRAKRFFSEGAFYTPDRKARLLPVFPRETGHALDDEFPLILNTGRVRDHWHTMTRTAKSARLSRHIAEPFLEIHPDDADALGLRDADLARVLSRHGSVVVRTRLSDRQRKGSVFSPMHWTAQNSNKGRIDALVRPLTDPISGQPESKRTPVRVERLAAVWHGFALTRTEARPDCAYWAAARTERGWRFELAGVAEPADVDAFARDLLGADGEILNYADPARGTYRIALFDEDRLNGALFLGPTPVSLARDWLANAFDAAQDEADLRRQFLAGRAGAGLPDPGPTVCVCESVGARVIEQAIAQGADSVDAIGVACRAGTNCGSCRTDLAEMLRAAQPAVAAE
ncbi:MAG: molybdopterin-dependent oxidoreductase, partial [Pseudomonadota bacterium]